MKKKLLIAILSTALILSFSACGNDKQQNVSSTQDNPIEENISHDFNADTNLQETAYNISYQIPGNWDKKVSDDDKDLVYYYSDTGMLMVDCRDECDNFLAEEVQDSFFQGQMESFDNYDELVRKNNSTTNNIYGVYSEFSATLDSTEISIAYEFVFNHNGRLFCFMYGDYVSPHADHSQDFMDIINSIESTTSDVTTEESINENTETDSATSENGVSSTSEYNASSEGNEKANNSSASKQNNKNSDTKKKDSSQTSSGEVQKDTSSKDASDSNSKPAASTASYQSILDKYSQKIKSATPNLVKEYKSESASLSDLNSKAELSNAKISELAEICNEGIGEMAELMYKNGDDYSTYEKWAGKLQDIYMDYAGQITDAYMNSAL